MTDTLDQLKKDARAAFAVAVLEVRDDVFSTSGGAKIHDARELLKNTSRYRGVLAAMTPYLIDRGLDAEIKHALNEVTDPEVGARWAYPVPLGGPNYQYVRFDSMTLAQFEAWHEMIEDRVGRIHRLLETADKVVDPLMPELKKHPEMTIGQARAQLRAPVAV